MYNENTIYIVGEAKSPSNNPITEQYQVFFIGFVVDTLTNEILEAECSAILSLTARFVKEIFTGASIQESERLVEIIQKRYHGSSQKAMVVALRNASLKYKQIKADM
ncbi:DUF3870 domain-containing protein [Marinococcus halophilus]|uniref:DUF3870 domain-containing protein n=1 Tax=Marinococcus halophilus TaxID=1371 RepID=A0A510Y5H0_MARHA|nr:DUF3870 domain-containing protein [Marinococcus halophilus]OZT78967.1 DUF3870 domain-containing protein [Marinococcus halophilus]GEK58588.1 hypothetical protein MHA01_14930 [Marinococcus halophilus]